MTLIQCPFCGFGGGYIGENNTAGLFAKRCCICGATGPTAKTSEEAETLWNRRDGE